MDSNKKLVDKLLEKLNKEYENFINEIKKLSPNEIIDRAYEITAKQEITNLYVEVFNDKVLNFLIKTDNLMDKIYNDFENNNGSFYSLVEEHAYDFINELSEEIRKKEREKER